MTTRLSGLETGARVGMMLAMAMMPLPHIIVTCGVVGAIVGVFDRRPSHADLARWEEDGGRTC